MTTKERLDKLAKAASELPYEEILDILESVVTKAKDDRPCLVCHKLKYLDEDSRLYFGMKYENGLQFMEVPDVRYCPVCGKKIPGKEKVIINGEYTDCFTREFLDVNEAMSYKEDINPEWCVMYQRTDDETGRPVYGIKFKRRIDRHDDKH